MTQNKVRITKKWLTGLDRLRPVSGKAWFRDESLSGFGVCITPSSSSWFAEKRGPGMKSAKRLVLGSIYEMDLDEARLKAREYMVAVEKGDLQNKPKKMSDEPLSLAQALELFLSARQLRPKSESQYRYCVRSYFADWLDRLVVDIGEDEVLERYQALSERAPGMAIKCFRMLGGVLSFCSGHPRLKVDGKRLMPIPPTRILTDLRAHKKLTPRTDYLSVDELALFRVALDKIRPAHRNLLLFLLYTGCRLEEARGLVYDEVNFLSGFITLPAHRVKTNKARVIPITKQLESLIQEQSTNRSQVCDYVFRSQTGIAQVQLIELRSDFEQVRSQIGRPDLMIHGLRRTYITHASDDEVMPEYVLKVLVGHSGDVTSMYRQVQARNLVAPAQRACDKLALLMNCAGMPTVSASAV